MALDIKIPLLFILVIGDPMNINAKLGTVAAFSLLVVASCGTNTTTNTNVNSAPVSAPVEINVNGMMNNMMNSNEMMMNTNTIKMNVNAMTMTMSGATMNNMMEPKAN